MYVSTCKQFSQSCVSVSCDYLVNSSCGHTEVYWQYICYLQCKQMLYNIDISVHNSYIYILYQYIAVSVLINLKVKDDKLKCYIDSLCCRYSTLLPSVNALKMVFCCNTCIFSFFCCFPKQISKSKLKDSRQWKIFYLCTILHIFFTWSYFNLSHHLYFSLTSPLLLVAIAACLGACYIINLKNKDTKVKVLGKSLVVLCLSHRNLK